MDINEIKNGRVDKSIIKFGDFIHSDASIYSVRTVFGDDENIFYLEIVSDTTHVISINKFDKIFNIGGKFFVFDTPSQPNITINEYIISNYLHGYTYKSCTEFMHKLIPFSTPLTFQMRFVYTVNETILDVINKYINYEK